MLKKLVILSALYLVVFVVVSNAQKNKAEEVPEVQTERVVESVSKPEPPREEPKREEPRTETPRQSSPPPSSSSQSNNSSPSNSDSSRSEGRKRRDPDSENPNGNRRRDRNRNENNPPRRKQPPPDVETPPPGDTTTPPPNSGQNPVPSPTNGDDKQGKNRDRDRNRENNKNRRRRNGRGYDYSTIPIFPSSSSPTPRPFSANAYFGENDIFFNIYGISVESDSSQFAPFFEDMPSEAFQPLYYTYGREFFINEFHFVSDDWAVYYEPDLDDVFINLAKLGQTKFERMVLYPVGDTVKKANKKFSYKGQLLRPVLVEKIPEIGADRLYSFSVHDLPKGEYELRLISRDGSIARHFIRLK